MREDTQFKAALKWLRKRAGVTGLRHNPYEGRWEIIKVENVPQNPGESQHVSYGFRCPYNDLIVGGLCELEVAQVLLKHRLVTSYAGQELRRQMA